MANHQSTKKSIRKTARRTIVNKMRVSTIRTYIKKVETQILAGDYEQAVTALRITDEDLLKGAG